MKLKTGDRVVISRVSYESGDPSWVHNMDKYIGEAGIVRSVATNHVRLKGNRWEWPHKALTKVWTIQLDFSVYKYIAQDEDGDIYLYRNKPALSLSMWSTVGIFVAEDFPDDNPLLPSSPPRTSEKTGEIPSTRSFLMVPWFTSLKDMS